MRVFLSYRRRDVGGYAGRLSDALVQRLGASSVFQDVTAIAPGRDFTVEIDRALDECDAVLAVIGPGWLTASSPDGTLRLLESDDYVRQELVRALTRDLPVIPVLVGGAALPAAVDLPVELRPLVQRQALELHDETWHEDVDGLTRALRGRAVSAPRRNRLAIGAVVVALAALGVGAWWWSGTAQRSDSQATLSPCISPSEGWNTLALNTTAAGEIDASEGAQVFTVERGFWRATDGRWQVTLATTMDNRTPGDVYHGEWLYDAVVVGRRRFEATCFSAVPDLVSPGTVGDALVGFDVQCEPAGYIQLELQNGYRLDVTSSREWGEC